MDIKRGREPLQIERLSIFELSQHLFGIPILQSREVIPIPRFTPLPNSSQIFLGVFNLRGEIYPVVDISPVLGLPPKQIHSDDMVILMENAGLVLGTVVDKIHKVLNYSPSEVKMAKGYASRIMENYLHGVLESEEKVIMILNLETLFSDHQVLAHF